MILCVLEAKANRRQSTTSCTCLFSG